MDQVEAIASIADHMATLCAVIIGALWALGRYNQQRVKYARVRTEISCTPMVIPEGWLLRAEVNIENIGNKLVKIENTELRMRQVVPLPEEIAVEVRGGGDPVPRGEQEILWPCLAQRKWDGTARGMEIEPGETDSLITDFFVPKMVSAVEFYLFVTNKDRAKARIGWTSTKIQLLAKQKGEPTWSN